MLKTGCRERRRARPFAAAVGVLLACVAGTPAAACELEVVRKAIDQVLDSDQAGKKFRKEFEEGADPFYILDQIVDAEMRRKIDVCRFQAAEYLTKRGFPPSH